MPRYLYHCEKCDSHYEYYHSMSEKKTQCESCKEDTLLKVPVFGGTIKKENQQKVGAIVEKHIEEAREEIRKEKENLKNFEFKPE